MGVAEIVIFAVCWLIVASLMLWGVFTEHQRSSVGIRRLQLRRRNRRDRSGRRNRRNGQWPATATGRTAPTDWIVLESTAGSGPDVEVQARLIAAALLASRGIDLETLPPGDLRTEVTTSSDGAGTTRILVRAGAMHASRRHR